MADGPVELADGLHRWTARHPAWHPKGFGDVVGSYAVDAGDGHVVVVDPLLPPEAPDSVLALLDALVAERLTVAVTLPYHVRDAATVWARYAERGVDAVVTGALGVARRLADDTVFAELVPGDPGARVAAFALTGPRRSERPLHLPSHGAVVFGDALVTTPDGELRVWDDEAGDPARGRRIAEQVPPALAPIIAADPDIVLVTHGEPVLGAGRAALERAAALPPWNHRASIERG